MSKRSYIFRVLGRSVLSICVFGGSLAVVDPFASGLAGGALADTVVFFNSIPAGRTDFDTRVGNANGTVTTDRLSGLPLRATSWARSGYTIQANDGVAKFVNRGYLAATGGGGTSGEAISITANTSVSAARGSGLLFTFSSPVNAFGIELGDWATCCYPSSLFISFDSGTDQLIGTANSPNDDPSFPAFGVHKTFIGAIDDSSTFSTVLIYGLAAGGDGLVAGGTIRYATLPVGGLSGNVVTSPGTIDSSQVFFDEASGPATASEVVFDGGTLRSGQAVILTQPVVVRAAGGTIDPAQGTLVLTGVVTGDGKLIVNGNGLVVVGGETRNDGGFTVQKGVLEIRGDGRVEGGVTVADGASVRVIGVVANGEVMIDGGTVQVSGVIDGAVSVAGNGTLDVTGLVNGTVLVSPGGLLTGSGVVAGRANVSGTIAPGTSPGTLVFTDDLEMAESSVLEIEIDGPGTGEGAGNHDRVVVLGVGNRFEAGGTLRTVLRGVSGDAGNDFSPELGQGFTIVEAVGGVAGAFESVDQPGPGLPPGTRVDVVYRPQAIDLRVTPEDYGNLAVLGIEETGNRRAVGAALEDQRAAPGARPDDAWAEVFDDLYTLDGTALARTLDQASGVLHAHTLEASADQRERFHETLNRRLAGGVAGGGALELSFAGTQMAASGLGAANEGAANQDAAERLDFGGWTHVAVERGRMHDDDAPGYEHKGGVLMVGADARLDDVSLPGARVGVAAGFAQSKVDGDTSLGDAKVRNYQIGAYGDYALGRLDVVASLSYAFGVYETDRTVRAATAESDSNGHGISAGVGVRYDVDTAALGLGTEVRLQPFAGLRYAGVWRDGFSEAGAGALSLSVDDEALQRVSTTVGVRLAGEIAMWEGAVLVPEARLAWRHAFGAALASVDASLDGRPFTTDGVQPGRDAVILGVGLSGQVTPGLTLAAGYDLEASSGATNHALSAGLKISW